jgi:hypothetical protein
VFLCGSAYAECKDPQVLVERAGRLLTEADLLETVRAGSDTIAF